MRRSLFAIAVVSATILLPAAALAQEDRPAYVRALAAGYKAGFLCSNLFNGGLSEAQTEADDLKGTYENFNPLFAKLEARIDRDRRTVSVAYDPAMPPRLAVWRPVLGCSQLPIGAAPEAAATLPRLRAKAPDLDARPWPMGDRGAIDRPMGDVRALREAVAKAFDRRSYGQGSETTAVLVLHAGRIIAEQYRPDMNMHSSQRTWSVGKSLAATVVGAAVQQGLIDVNAAAPVPEWKAAGDPRGRITTDQLLRMASGLNSDHAGNRTCRYAAAMGTSRQKRRRQAISMRKLPFGVSWRLRHAVHSADVRLLLSIANWNELRLDQSEAEKMTARPLGDKLSET